MTTDRTVLIALPGGQSVAGVWTDQAEPSGSFWAFVYAPGAGATQRDGFGIFAAQHLATAGVSTLRFQFPYTEAGRRIPDRTAVLEATWRAAIEAARGHAARLVVGGRSMGGRIASQVVAKGQIVDALALFAYPLHPPGQPANLRDGHLDRVGVPTLFCSGTRDAFAIPAELQRAAALVPHAHVKLLEGADHGFRVAKATGRTQEDIWSEALAGFTPWLGDGLTSAG